MTTPPTTPPPPLPLPGGLPLPESNGTGTWSTVSNGITVELRMEPVAPHAGDNVHFSITASDPNQPCCVTTLYLGDETFVPPPRYDVPCPAASPSVFTEEVDHVYAQAGAFEVHVEPAANNFCAGPMTAFVSAHLLVRILVLP